MEFEPKFSPETKSSKNKKEWEEALKEIENLEDELGMEVDEGIKEAVAALHLHEIPTNQSCEGHIDRGLDYPWVDVSAKPEPEERFINESKIFKKVAEKYNVSLQGIKNPWRKSKPEEPLFEKLMEAKKEAVSKMSRNGYTEEMEEWLKENEKLKERVENLIEEFSDDNIKTKQRGNQGSFRVISIDEYGESLDELEEKEKKKVLKNRRKKMNEFANFLKEKYFSENNN